MFAHPTRWYKQPPCGASLQVLVGNFQGFDGKIPSSFSGCKTTSHPETVHYGFQSPQMGFHYVFGDVW
jgi:hypothetical protein